MAKKNKKKSKNGKHGPENQGMGWNGPPQNAGLLGGLSKLLPSSRSNQFLLGALIGAAAAYVLSDDELRGKMIKSGLKLYSGLLGGVEEMKEQVADIQAEMQAEQSADS